MACESDLCTPMHSQIRKAKSRADNRGAGGTITPRAVAESWAEDLGSFFVDRCENITVLAEDYYKLI